MLGERFFSALATVTSAIPLRYAYGLAGLVVGLALGFMAGSAA